MSSTRQNRILAISMALLSTSWAYGMSFKVDIKNFDLDYKQGDGKLSADNFEVISNEMEMTSRHTDLLIKVDETSMLVQKDELKLKMLGMKNEELAQTDLVARNASILLDKNIIKLTSPVIKYNETQLNSINVNCQGKEDGADAAFTDILRTCVGGQGYIKAASIDDLEDSTSFLNLDNFQMQVMNNKFYMEGKTDKFLNPKLVLHGTTSVTDKYIQIALTSAKLGPLSVKGKVLSSLGKMKNKNISVSGNNIYITLSED